MINGEHRPHRKTVLELLRRSRRNTRHSPRHSQMNKLDRHRQSESRAITVVDPIEKQRTSVHLLNTSIHMSIITKTFHGHSPNSTICTTNTHGRVNTVLNDDFVMTTLYSSKLAPMTMNTKVALVCPAHSALQTVTTTYQICHVIHFCLPYSG